MVDIEVVKVQRETGGAWRGSKNHVRVDCLALGRECVKWLGRLGFAQRIEREVGEA